MFWSFLTTCHRHDVRRSFKIKALKRRGYDALNFVEYLGTNALDRLAAGAQTFCPKTEDELRDQLIGRVTRVTHDILRSRFDQRYTLEALLDGNAVAIVREKGIARLLKNVEAVDEKMCARELERSVKIKKELERQSHLHDIEHTHNALKLLLSFLAAAYEPDNHAIGKYFVDFCVETCWGDREIYGFAVAITCHADWKGPNASQVMGFLPLC